MNPIKPFVLEILSNNIGQPFKEYDLFKCLDHYIDEWPFQSSDDNVNLFRKHFLVMNALYTLKTEYYPHGYHIEAEPLNIMMCYQIEGSQYKLSTEVSDRKLSEYYLDWQNLLKTTQEDVESLLTAFWEKYYNIDKIEAACQVLSISTNASVDALKTAYQRLAQKHHPDKGGDPQYFIQIRQAYELLLTYH